MAVKFRDFFKSNAEGSRTDFQRKQPITDNGSGLWNKLKHLAATAAVAFCLSTGCSSEPDPILPNTLVTMAAVTDSEGHVSFDIRGNIFELNAQDPGTGEGISNLTVVISAKNEGGIYHVSDPTNYYQTKLIGTSLTPSAQEESNKVSNVLVSPRETICDAPASFYTSGLSPAELWDYRDLPNDPENVLKRSFSSINVEGTTDPKLFPLSHLDDALRLIIEEVEENLESSAVEGYIRALLSVKIKALEGAAGLPGHVLLLADACAMNNTLSWADYYRGLCYEDNDYFEIWRLAGFRGIDAYDYGLDVSIFSNPIFLILPVDSPSGVALEERDGQTTWEAPVAQIAGLVQNEPANPLVRTAILENLPGLLPTVAAAIPNNSYTSDGEFFITAGACPNYVPSYSLTLSTSGAVTANLSTSLYAQDEESYSISFHPTSACEDEDYRTYYSADDQGYCSIYDRRIACSMGEGYLAEGECIFDLPPYCHLVSTSSEDFHYDQLAGTAHLSGGTIILGTSQNYQFYDVETRTTEAAPSCESLFYSGDSILCDNQVTNMDTNETYLLPDFGSIGSSGQDGNITDITIQNTIMFGIVSSDTMLSGFVHLDLPAGYYDVFRDEGEHPRLSGNLLTYQIPTTQEIRIVELSSGSEHNVAQGFNPEISGTNVIFYSVDGGDYVVGLADVSNLSDILIEEIFREPNLSDIELSRYRTRNFDISEDHAVLSLPDGILLHSISMGSNTTFYSGNTTSLQIDGNYVVFTRPGQDEYEIIACLIE